MEGIISNFRKSVHVQKDNHMIVLVNDVDSREKAEKLVGKEVEFKTESGKIIAGKVAAAHGNKGAVRVIFEKGMPGQSVTQKVQIK